MVTLVLLIVCLAILAHFIRDVGYYFIDAVKECISRTHVSCDDSPRYLRESLLKDLHGMLTGNIFSNPDPAFEQHIL